MSDRINLVTKSILERLPVDTESPCGITAEERDAVVFYMSCETLRDIATCKRFVFVATWRRRAATWPVHEDAVSKTNTLRYGPIAQAVIAFVQEELEKLNQPDE